MAINCRKRTCLCTMAKELGGSKQTGGSRTND